MPTPDPDRSTDDENPLRDALSGVNAEQTVTDPDEQQPRPDEPPAATPDSPNPI
jgi:hypothetical protein